LRTLGSGVLLVGLPLGVSTASEAWRGAADRRFAVLAVILNGLAFALLAFWWLRPLGR
jgi:hypothetical protein